MLLPKSFVRDSYDFESYVVIYTGMRNRKIVYSLWDNCADEKTTVDETQMESQKNTWGLDRGQSGGDGGVRMVMYSNCILSHYFA
ncbi:hypothetical protein RHMOL_Rhmol10G0307200 [Rhododendron molle]|uniref:Uncharacterized protein n=1 Tax=Rhododendron molle TaxID=49168 RepID=A0ACC0M7Z8_RHOML|nr:hypothetical protein RHMOL_Rhmol10G0307200 [Rhododendron molle]